MNIYTFESPCKIHQDDDEYSTSDDIYQLVNRLNYISEDDDLAEYLDSDVPNVLSIKVSFETRNDTIFTHAHVTTQRTLSKAKQKEMMDYLSGQYSDGWGETLEQLEMTINGIDYNVSTWFDHKSWYIKLISCEQNIK